METVYIQIWKYSVYQLRITSQTNPCQIYLQLGSLVHYS